MLLKGDEVLITDITGFVLPYALRPLATDTAGKLGHDGDTLGVDGA